MIVLLSVLTTCRAEKNKMLIKQRHGRLMTYQVMVATRFISTSYNHREKHGVSESDIVPLSCREAPNKETRGGPEELSIVDIIP